MDLQRALLDELMGKSRDGEHKGKKYKFDDKEKADTGPCPRVHDAGLVREYEREKERAGHDFGFELEWETDMAQYISDCDRSIKRSQARIEADDMKVSISVEDDPEVIKITKDIKECVEEAERLGEEGKVDESQELMKKAEDLKEQKIEVSAQAAKRMMPPEIASIMQNPGQNQKLRCCEICGALLSVLDSDRRLADHFGGKLHLGYAKLREHLEKLKTTKRKRFEERHSGAGEDRASKRPREDRDRDRRDRDRDRDRDRRSRDRDSDRRRDHDRGDRDRDRDRRDRDRDRERDRR